IALDALSEPELAFFAFPALRGEASAVETAVQALSGLVPGAGRRIGTVRRMGAMLYDLPSDEAETAAALATVAKIGAADAETTPFARELAILRAAAEGLRRDGTSS